MTTLGIISQLSATAKNPPKSEITINDTNNHKKINLQKGKILIIKLSANPSTGYNWQIIKNDPQKLKPLGTSVFEPLPTATGESQVKLVGSPENQVFRFFSPKLRFNPARTPIFTGLGKKYSPNQNLSNYSQNPLTKKKRTW